MVPLQPKAGWDEAKAFCEAFAQAMAKEQPDRYVATMSKAKRKGKIFIDWLRNGRGATAVACDRPRVTGLRWRWMSRPSCASSTSSQRPA